MKKTLTLFLILFFVTTNSLECHYLVSGSKDGTTKIWDIKTGKEITSLGAGSIVYSVAFSKDGEYLASGSKDGTIIWDTKTWKEITTLKGHTGSVYSVAFSQDGEYLATGSRDKTIKIWEVGTWKEITTLKGHTDWVFSVAFSQDDKYLASGSRDTTIKIWNTKTWEEKTTLRGHTGWVFSVAFSKDGENLASGSSDGTLKIWEISTWKNVAEMKETQEEKRYAIYSVAYSTDDSYFALGGDKGKIAIMDFKKEGWVSLIGPKKTIFSVAFSKDNKYLASGSADKTIKIIDTKTLEIISILRGHTKAVRSVAFFPIEIEQKITKEDLEERIEFIKEHPEVREEQVTISIDGETLQVPLVLLPKTISSSQILRVLFTNRRKKYDELKKESPDEAKKIRDEMIEILKELLKLKTKERLGAPREDVMKIERQELEISNKLQELEMDEILYLKTKK